MEPMFLSEIEANTTDSSHVRTVGRERGVVPQIWHLIAYKPESTRHLMRFTQEVMRGASPLSSGFRELIAAFTAKVNHCPF